MTITEQFPIGSIWFHKDWEWRLKVVHHSWWKDFDGEHKDHVHFDVISINANGRIMRGEDLQKLARDEDGKYCFSDAFQEYTTKVKAYWTDKVVHYCRDAGIVHGPAVRLITGIDIMEDYIPRTFCGTPITEGVMYRVVRGSVNCPKCLSRS